MKPWAPICDLTLQFGQLTREASCPDQSESRAVQGLPPSQVPLRLCPLGTPGAAPWPPPERAPACTRGLRCGHSPSLPQAGLQGHPERVGGWEEEARGGQTLHRVRADRQPAQPLPRWLDVDKDRRTCKMATSSRAGREGRPGATIGPLPPAGVLNPAPLPVPSRDQPGPPFLTSFKHEGGGGALRQTELDPKLLHY